MVAFVRGSKKEVLPVRASTAATHCPTSCVSSLTSCSFFASSSSQLRPHLLRLALEERPSSPPPPSGAQEVSAPVGIGQPPRPGGAPRQPRNGPWLHACAAQDPAGLLAASFGVEASAAVARRAARPPPIPDPGVSRS